MKRIFNQYAWTAIAAVLTAYMGSAVAAYVLPKYSIEYIKYSPKETFLLMKPSKQFCPSKEISYETNEILDKGYESFSGFSLKAVTMQGNGGFVVIEDNGKEVFLTKGESYKGYKLIKLYPKSAVFARGEKLYSIELQEPKMASQPKSENIGETKETKVLSRKELERYKREYGKLYRQIALAPIVTKNGFGYKVTYLKKGSPLESLGLKQGDVILSINGNSVKNRNIFDNLINNSENIEYISLEVERNNRKKELSYEIR